MGKLHILACKRHLEDLKRQGTNEFPYIWKPEKSERILEYAETLTIGEGFEATPVKLLGSQIFDIGCPFGWLKLNEKEDLGVLMNLWQDKMASHLKMVLEEHI